MWPDARLMRLFGIELPVLQAPMAGSSSLAMAAAVSAAGGLGALAAATLQPDALRDALAAARQAGIRRLNVNFFAARGATAGAERDAPWLGRLAGYCRDSGTPIPDRLSPGAVRFFDAESCAVIEEFAPAVVSFHFGLPDAGLLRRVKACGATVVSSATTVAEARWLAVRGCDAVIAQGYEAGGHRGMFLTDDVHSQVGTLALVPQVADAIDVPVIAAGGVADGRGVAAALALGAAGVQVGTAYLFTEEAAVNGLYRTALEGAAQSHTAITNVFSGRPARCLVNRLVRDAGPMATEAAGFPRGFSALAPLKQTAEQSGSADFSAHYGGQAAALGGKGGRREGAAALTRRLAREAQARLAWLAGPAAAPV